eukprot:gene4579-14760_t
MKMTCRYTFKMKLHLPALEGRKRVLGADHLDTITSLDNLASCFNDQERFQEAEALYQQAVEGRKRELGADRHAP